VPADVRTADDVRRAIRPQTTCVRVEVGHVDWGLVREGRLALPVDNRTWIAGGEAIKVWVEGDSTDDCAPARAGTVRRADCPGGLQPVPVPYQ
jgi:hypothetical protein